MLSNILENAQEISGIVNYINLSGYSWMLDTMHCPKMLRAFQKYVLIWPFIRNKIVITY